MTDKVIIDGVDVSRCEHYLNKECLCQYNEIDGRIFKLYRCDTFENCYYKQLQRKEQECEELKEELDTAKINYSNECDFRDLYRQQRDRYQQALERIEEIIERYEDWDLLKNIQNIINEVTE